MDLHVLVGVAYDSSDTQMHGQQMYEHRAMPFSTNRADIDECAVGLDLCDANAGCTNTDGSYVCTCNSGYTGSGLSCSGNSHMIDMWQTDLHSAHFRC